MRRSERQSKIIEANDLLNTITREQERVIEQLESWAGGFPTGNGTSGSGHSDRTGTLATMDRPDQFLALRTKYDRSLETALLELRNLHRIVLIATTPVDTVDAVTWCQSCARVKDHRGDPVCTPAHRGSYCRWCGDWRSLKHSDPPVTILKIHLRGERVTERMVEQHTRRTA